jgi:hypothetical protein
MISLEHSTHRKAWDEECALPLCLLQQHVLNATGHTAGHMLNTFLVGWQQYNMQQAPMKGSSEEAPDWAEA